MEYDTANGYLNMHPRIRERRFWVKYSEWKRLCYSRLADPELSVDLGDDINASNDEGADNIFTLR